MTNLLPAHAKKRIKYEYWARVVGAWLLVWSFCLVLGAALLYPTYVLLSGQSAAVAESASAATERTAEFDDLRDILQQATKKGQDIISLSSRVRLSDIMNDVTSAANDPAISISGISIVYNADEGLTPLQVTGKAEDRQALAQLRDRLEALPYVETVDLPIQNLAKNEDISFSLTVHVDNQAL